MNNYMHIDHQQKNRKINVWLVPLLLVAFALASSAVSAKSEKSKLMDNMRVEFDQAIINGDTDRASKIWTSIDSRFNDKYDELAARSMILGGGSITWQKQLNKLHQQQPVKFERMADFLSSINLNFINSDVHSTNGNLSGTVTADKNKRVANVTIVFAGHKTTTDENGEFSLSELPDGTFDLLAFASGYQLTGDQARTVSENKNTRLSLRLHASNYKLPQISQTEANAKMDNAMAQIDKALKAAEPTGSETIEGTVVDAESGQPIAGAKFMISPAKADVSLSQVAVTDSNGHFILTGVRTGVSEIAIIPANAVDHLPFGQTVNMTGGKTHTVTWKLEHVKQQQPK